MNDAVKEVQIRAGILHRRVQSGDQTALKRFRRPAGPTRCGAHINLWYRTRAHAAEVWRQRGGYLLAYRRQFLIVDRFYIETLGLDPDDPPGAPSASTGRARMRATALASPRAANSIPPSLP